VHLPIHCFWNGLQVGQAEAGEDMVFNFAELIAHATKTRRARAGSIIGSGTISNKDASHGYSCVAEIRALEAISDGKSSTAFMKFGDHIRIEMLDKSGQSIFGAIEQEVVAHVI